jgi:glycosyltransferase involved in cell wall biosynthesis
VTNRIALLTGGGDKPYALGIASALASAGVPLDFIGSDDLESPDLLKDPQVRFLNLRGDQRPDADITAKLIRVFAYYLRLLRYAVIAEPRIFHILWNNKLELFDRTLLMLYYKLLGKKVVLTVHNVNGAARDGRDSISNRLSLRVQYMLTDHLFVHTAKMKHQLLSDFAVNESKVSVIPFGINNTVPNTTLSRPDARVQIGFGEEDRVLLFFGNIAPYKGLEYLVEAFIQLAPEDARYRLLIVGRPKQNEAYWRGIRDKIRKAKLGDRIYERIEYVSDEDTEIYFKAADILVIPYTYVFQSGVLFLGYSFGLPVIVTDVGSLKDEIVEGKTGFVCKPADSLDLADAIRMYFRSELYRNLPGQRRHIQAYANERYSWGKVVAITTAVYSSFSGNPIFQRQRRQLGANETWVDGGDTPKNRV